MISFDSFRLLSLSSLVSFMALYMRTLLLRSSFTTVKGKRQIVLRCQGGRQSRLNFERITFLQAIVTCTKWIRTFLLISICRSRRSKLSRSPQIDKFSKSFWLSDWSRRQRLLGISFCGCYSSFVLVSIISGSWECSLVMGSSLEGSCMSRSRSLGKPVE